MELSEAIQAGSRHTRPITGHFFIKDGTDKPFACALGAALYAGIPGADIGSVDWMIATMGLWPIAAYEVACPGCGSGYPSLNHGPLLASVVVSLNDVHGWTREQIAAWVAEKERCFAKAKEIEFAAI